LNKSWNDESPEKLIGDKAYDSDPMDEKLENDYGIELIAPNRSNRIKQTQDKRKLRRYKRRWKIERLNAWLQNFRRVVVRWDYKAENFMAFVLIACIIIVCRNTNF